ncbi:MAG TPA: aromatic ring-hydroxylating dioxygenase subunit alpha [Acidimicrobiales bacterium]|nr:aromatic ring-hydroxylating dioxygenase subunit alpha [Acidimicrobiales bacterium]
MTAGSVVVDAWGYGAEDYAVLGIDRLGGLYTDTRVLDLERTRLFASSWALVATADELAEPGSYVTTTVAGIPLVVLRAADGRLRALHNVCRHRGMTLLSGSGTVGRFLTCPYHQWSFDQCGALVRVPQQDEQFADLDRCALGLHQAQVEDWHGMVFVNPSVDAPALSEAMCGLDRGLDSFVAGPLVQVACVQYEAACNWKFLVENHIDVYHLWYLHARSLAPYDHRSFAWESMGDNWWSLEPLKDPAGVAVSLSWIEDHMRHRIGAYLLFPNLMLVTTDDYFATYDATPLSPDRTLLTLRVRATAKADAGALVASIRSFMAEDVHACERMQQGASSPSFGVGATARTHEEPLHRFHRSLRARVCP